MGKKKIIIIGAGIAGLSAGCYAQMNGYDTTILEMHDKPGGLCTAWKRKGYTIDFCIHHTAGSSSVSALYPIWQELGALQERDVVFHDEFVRVENEEGKSFCVYTDLDKLSKHMKELAPDDADVIDEYINAIRAFTRIELLAFPLLKPWEAVIRVLPVFPALKKWGKYSMSQFADRFSDPFLQKAFPVIQYGLPDVPLFIHLNFMAWCAKEALGWPKGGSLVFAKAIEDRYLRLGGRVEYNKRVEKINVEDNQAVGVTTADGTEYQADIVISAADGYKTIYHMLEGRFTNETLQKYYASPPKRCDMSLQVFLGVAHDMSKEPHALAFFLDQPISIAGELVERLDVEIFNFDKSLSPKGKFLVKVLFGTQLAYWKKIENEREQYLAQKQIVADTVISCLEKRFPGISGNVEMIDVSTPLTIERFTGNWQGILAPWPPSGGFSAAMKGLSRTLPGLKNFYMAGQWGEAMIGISTVAVAARNIVKAICKKDGKRFITWKDKTE